MYESERKKYWPVPIVSVYLSPFRCAMFSDTSKHWYMADYQDPRTKSTLAAAFLNLFYYLFFLIEVLYVQLNQYSFNNTF